MSILKNNKAQQQSNNDKHANSDKHSNLNHNHEQDSDFDKKQKHELDQLHDILKEDARQTKSRDWGKFEHINDTTIHAIKLVQQMGDELEANGVIPKHSMFVELGIAEDYTDLVAFGFNLPTNTFRFHMHIHPNDCAKMDYGEKFLSITMNQLFSTYMTDLEDIALKGLKKHVYPKRDFEADLLYVWQIMLSYIHTYGNKLHDMSFVDDNRYDGYMRSSLISELDTARLRNESFDKLATFVNANPENVLGSLFYLGQIMGRTKLPQPKGLNMLINMRQLSLPKLDKDKYGRPIIKCADCHAYPLM